MWPVKNEEKMGEEFESRNLNSFRDILKCRRDEASNFMWVSRPMNLVVPYRQLKRRTPKKHKIEVLESQAICDLINRVRILLLRCK